MNIEQQSISTNPNISRQPLNVGQRRLQLRGLLAAAATSAWQSHDASQRWYYPATDPLTHATAQRSKAYDSASRYKYLWHSAEGKAAAKPAGLNYYAPQGIQHLRAAIQHTQGTLYIANGEPAVLTVLAAGRDNVLSWYGEGSIPKTLPADLQLLGIKRVLFPADRDAAGHLAAAKVRDRLTSSGIQFIPLELPATLPTKADLNDVWLHVTFDPAAFWTLVDACPVLALPPPAPRRDTLSQPLRPRDPQAQPDGRTWDEVRREVTQAMERTFDIQRYNANGWSNNFVNHWRGETRKSAGYNVRSGTLKDFGGETLTLKDLAAQFNILLPTPTPQRPRRPSSKSQTDQSNSLVRSCFTGTLPLAERIRPFALRPLTADLPVNLRYISDLDTAPLPRYGALLVKSEIGTGKTELVKRLIAEFTSYHGHQPSVLAITHRQALARDIAERLDLECYQDFTAGWLKSATQLVSCYNSEHKRQHTDGIPTAYDLVVIDECEQFHAHLGSNTFRGGEALLNYEVVRRTVQAAGTVVCLDAHASTISRDWLQQLKGVCFTVVNAHAAPAAPLTLYAKRHRALQTALDLIDAREGVVVIPMGSRAAAHELHSLLCERYGPSAGRLVCGDNSETADTQHFIRNINTQLPTLRYLIYTSSLGTGVDITAPVRAVVGIFGLHLAATEVMQMLGRCRHRRETHAYVPATEAQFEQDWQVIYQQHAARALRTAELCTFDAHHIPHLTPLQQDALRLLAQLEAERNRSRNNLLGHTVALAQAQGCPLKYHDGDAPEVRQALKAHAERLAAMRQAAVLAAQSVDYLQLAQHRAQGTLTETVRMGHERFLIEDTVGLTINPQIYQDLHPPPQREKLRRFTDLESAVEELMESDRSEARENYLLNKRRHRLAQRNLLVKVIQLVFGAQGLGFDGELTGAEIDERMAQFLEAHKADMHLYFNRRADLSDKPVAIFRWLLARIGVRLASRQVERRGARFMVYFLDAEHLAKWQGYATARRQHLAQQALAAEMSPKIAQNTNEDLRNVRALFSLTDEEKGAKSVQKE